MNKLSLLKVNYGDHQVEKGYCDFFASFNGAKLIMSNNLLILSKDKEVAMPIQFMESDFFTDTWKGQFFYGSEEVNFRVVRPNQRYIRFTGNIITFASLYHDGYAVHYNVTE